jgi:hypothetical protein
MDAVALAAVVGLAYIGKQMTDAPPTQVPKQVPVTIDTQVAQPPIGRKETTPSFRDIVPDATRHTYGQPVYNTASRENVTNTMKNLSPNPWTRVGPGLGVGPDVPATGGFHQYIREIPVNPTAPVARGTDGSFEFAKNRPDQVYTRAPMPGSAVIRAPEGRSRFVKGSRSTIKDQTIGRETDLLGAPLIIANNPMNSAYMVTGNQSLDRKDARAKPHRAGNPGNMNVRAHPLGAHGMLTGTKSDQNSVPMIQGAAPIPNGYIRTAIQEVNPYKDTPNALATGDSLTIAKRQLKDNVYNHTFSE